MYIHKEKRLVYLAHPRTASQATAAALREDCQFIKVVPGDHHMQLSAPESIVNPEERHQWMKFTTVRNHWDACVSWLMRSTWGADDGREVKWNREDVANALDRNKWVGKDKMWARHSGDADVILRYESLEDDLNWFLSAFGLSCKLPKKNVTPGRNGRHYREFFTADGCSYIHERFRDEIEALGYSYD